MATLDALVVGTVTGGVLEFVTVLKTLVVTYVLLRQEDSLMLVLHQLAAQQKIQTIALVVSGLQQQAHQNTECQRELD